MRQTILLLVLLMNIGLVTAQDDGKVDSKYHPVIYLHYDDAGNQDHASIAMTMVIARCQGLQAKLTKSLKR